MIAALAKAAVLGALAIAMAKACREAAHPARRQGELGDPVGILGWALAFGVEGVALILLALWWRV